MGFFDFLSKSRAPIERRDADAPVNVIRAASFGFGSTPVTYEAQVRASNALANQAIYRCVNKLAEAVQGVNWEVRKVGTGRRAGRSYSNSDKVQRRLQEVLSNPNDMFGPAQMRYWMTLHFALTGNVFLKIGHDSLGQVNAIYPLPHTSEAITGKSGAVKEIRYDIQSKPIPTRRFAPAGSAWAAHIYRPAFDLTKFDNSPIVPAGIAADIVRLLMHRAIETASGHPNVKHLLTSSKDMTDAQFNAMVDQFRAGAVGGHNSGNVIFVAGEELKVTALDNGMKDIHSKMPLDDMTRQIAGVFGVPASLLGIGSSDAAKYASNYAESRLAFYQDTIIPGYLRPLADGLTEAICPVGYEIVFDLDSIEALADARLAKAERLTKIDFLTSDEKRELCDFPPIAGAPAQEG